MVSFAFLMSSVYTASGAVIQEVIMTGDFGLDGLPVGDQFVFIPQDDDAVYVYFNMTDVYAGDTITFKYIQPSGAVYYLDEWVAYDWLNGESYNTRARARSVQITLSCQISILTRSPAP
jgi:hypothetical protein